MGDAAPAAGPSAVPGTGPRHDPRTAPAPPEPVGWRSPVGPLLLWSVVGLVVAALAVLLGGAAPQPAPAWLPDPGPVPGWSLPFLRLAQHAAALVVVGGLLAALLSGRAVGRALVAGAAGAWVLAALGSLVVGLAEVVARPVPDVLQTDLLRFYALEVPQGRALLLTAGLAALVAVAAVAAPSVHGRTSALPLLLVALVAVAPPVTTGHAASGANHRLAQSAVVLHVLAAVLWVGGLAALALLRRSSGLATAAARFSPVALACAVAVGLSGALSAYLNLEELAQLWSTGYGRVLLLKSVALALLVVAGARHRRRTLPELGTGAPGAFRRLAVGEVAVMAVAFGLAAALGRTPLG